MSVLGKVTAEPFDRIGLHALYSSMKAHEELAAVYQERGNDTLAHKHESLAFEDRGNLIAHFRELTGFSVEKLRDVLA